MSGTPEATMSKHCIEQGVDIPGPSSRKSADAAGWEDAAKPPYGAEWERLMDRRERNRWGNFAWFSPAPLLASLNDWIAKGIDDLVNTRRPAWVAAQRNARRGDGEVDPREAGAAAVAGDRVAGEMDLAIVDHTGTSSSFLILGDPGEADASQYAVVSPLLAEGGETDFMLIASDVVYPAGDTNDYIDAFYVPYAEYRHPIYAIPGNHDWYDGLNGFMWHFCGAEPLAPTTYRARSYTSRERLARRLWRKPSAPKLATLMRHRATRPGAECGHVPSQPGPYFSVVAGQLLVVAIDTGITGVLDREQAEWLRCVSRDPRPKLLVTGKPIYVDNEYHPGRIDWGDAPGPDRPEECRAHRTVDDIVRDPEHNYVAAIGGDIHNYQRYSVCVHDQYPDEGRDCRPRRGKEGRPIEYIVAGGGGAFLSATHPIGKVGLSATSRPTSLPYTVDAVTEEGFRCYPLRGDSLARFALRFGRVLFWAVIAAVVVLVGSAVAIRVLASRNLGPAPLWQLLVSVLGVVGTASVLVGLGMLVAQWAPRGLRAFAGLGVSLSAAVVVLSALSRTQVWTLAWETAVATGVVVPLLIVLLFLWPIVRGRKTRFLGDLLTGVLVCLLGFALLAERLNQASPQALYVLLFGSLVLAVVLLTLLFRALRRARPRIAGGLRVALPAFFGAVALLVFEGLREWLVHFLVASWAILIGLSVALLAIGWRAIPALPRLYSGRLDPDEAVRFVADELGTDSERPVEKSVPPGSRRLANVFFSTPLLNEFISEIAEANQPPFFKSFLRLDVEGGKLTITCYGVTGFAEDERSPTIEDLVEITLPAVRDVSPAPGTVARTGEPPDVSGPGDGRPRASAPPA